MEWVVALVEALDLLHVRRAGQPAVEPIRPGVIRTLDRLREAPTRRLAQPRPAMPADVVERANGPGAITKHDDALAGDVGEHVRARFGDALLTRDANPFAREDAIAFVGEDVGRRIVAARERLGAGSERFDGSEEGGHELLGCSLLGAGPAPT